MARLGVSGLNHGPFQGISIISYVFSDKSESSIIRLSKKSNSVYLEIEGKLFSGYRLLFLPFFPLRLDGYLLGLGRHLLDTFHVIGDILFSLGSFSSSFLDEYLFYILVGDIITEQIHHLIIRIFSGSHLMNQVIIGSICLVHESRLDLVEIIVLVHRDAEYVPVLDRDLISLEMLIFDLRQTDLISRLDLLLILFENGMRFFLLLSIGKLLFDILDNLVYAGILVIFLLLMFCDDLELFRVGILLILVDVIEGIYQFERHLPQSFL